MGNEETEAPFREEDAMRLILDTREPWQRPRALFYSGDMTLERAVLKTSDLALSAPLGAIVKRKHMADLRACLAGSASGSSASFAEAVTSARSSSSSKAASAMCCGPGRRVSRPPAAAFTPPPSWAPWRLGKGVTGRFAPREMSDRSEVGRSLPARAGA